MITAKYDGFIFLVATKEVVTRFRQGNNIYLCEPKDIFYGNRTEAIEFGLIFKAIENE